MISLLLRLGSAPKIYRSIVRNHRKMSYYPLFDYNHSSWLDFTDRASKIEFEKFVDIQKFIFDDSIELNSIENLKKDYSESEIVNVFNQARKFSLKIPELIPSGKVLRLTESNSLVEFTRSEVLCLICHMLLCSLKKTNQNKYWVNFENWLTDGRPCALVYLKTLIEYLKQSFNTYDSNEQNMMNEIISFKRIKCELSIAELLASGSNVKLCNVDIKLQGGIGDVSANEVDFANCDIGYGVTGTQEEILFGASPEMCVAMLFCDTLLNHEAIIIKGARGVALFEGYGMNLKFKSLNSIKSKSWNDRCVIAIDAIDFSEHSNTFKIQIEANNLERELKKSIAGFSGVLKGTSIDTGHWGCGAFCGNRYIKSVIQLIASSLTSNDLIYFCHGDNKFYEDFVNFLKKLHDKNVSVKALWKSLNSELVEHENVFNQLIKHVE